MHVCVYSRQCACVFVAAGAWVLACVVACVYVRVGVHACVCTGVTVGGVSWTVGSGGGDFGVAAPARFIAGERTT